MTCPACEAGRGAPLLPALAAPASQDFRGGSRAIARLQAAQATAQHAQPALVRTCISLHHWQHSTSPHSKPSAAFAFHGCTWPE